LSLERGGRYSRAFVDFTLRHGAVLWAIAIAIAIPAAWRTASLYAHLRGELEQLLPRTAPSVVALDELRARMPGLQYLGVVVEAKAPEDVPAADRLLDDLAGRVRNYPRDLVQSVRTGDEEERRFVEDHAALYADLDDLRLVLHDIEARRDWEAARGTGALLDEDQPPPTIDFERIRAKYDERAGGHVAGSGRFSSLKLRTSLMLIQAGGFDTGRRAGEILLARTRADLAELHPESYAPGLRVGFTGGVAIQVEEAAALKSDLTLSGVLVAVCEIAVIVLYYRWWRAVLLLLPPLLLATVASFALASLWPLHVTELNSNTAFLGSILAGSGINFGIVLLARYVEERRAGVGVRDALVVAVWGARKGTSAAALAAGASYAALALTDFQGFRQFGLVGGVGMLLAWAFAFVLTPPLAAWFDRAPRLPAARRSAMPKVARMITRQPVAILCVAGFLSVCAATQLRRFGPGRIETDFSTLRRSDTWTTGEGYWGRRMDALLGAYLTPTVILADSEAQARAIGGALSADILRPPLDGLIARVLTIDDIVPRDQEEKVRIVDRIREDLTPRIRAGLTNEKLGAIDRLLGRAPLLPFTRGDVPGALLAGMRERDGSVGRAVLVYPRPTRALWEGRPLSDLVARLRSAAMVRTSERERAGRVAGSLPLSSDLLDSIHRDAVFSSIAAFAGVVAVVLLLLRWSAATFLVLSSLLLGVLWLFGASTALDIKLSFANFIAYPITFGIGVDYSVNVAGRWEADGRGSMAGAVGTTGGAVLLCSLTTIIGYSSLLLAQNRGLYLFGLLAVLGEVSCVSTALLVLPAGVEVLRRRFSPEPTCGTMRA
jgi:predicted RND superfamily exporter protein